MRAFEYTTPSTIQQAVSALGANSRALAGGTDWWPAAVWTDPAQYFSLHALELR